MSNRTPAGTEELERALRGEAPHRQSTNRAGSGIDSEASAAAERLGERISNDGLADVSYASVDSPFGRLLLAATKRGLVRVAFPEEDADSVLERLAARISPRIVEASAPLEPARRELEEYFAGHRHRFEQPLDWALVGPFGRRVLRVTAKIPYGGALSYAARAQPATHSAQTRSRSSFPATAFCAAAVRWAAMRAG